MPTPSPSLRDVAADRRRAFTLSELLVALTITGLTAALVLPFFLFNLRSLYHGEQKLLINGDIRSLTNAMMENAREANYFTLYQGFHSHSYLRDMNGDSQRNAADRSLGGEVAVARDVNGDGVINALDRRVAGDAGDFLLLVFTRNNAVFDSRFYDGIPGNEPANTNQVVRLVGYWLAPNTTPPARGEPADRVALYTFDTERFKTNPGAASWTTPWGVTFPVTITGSTTLESLLPPATKAASTDPAYASIVVNNLDGLTASGNCFLNFGNKTAVVQARVLHGNRAKRVTNTYNFAVTPRG